MHRLRSIAPLLALFALIAAFALPVAAQEAATHPEVEPSIDLAELMAEPVAGQCQFHSIVVTYDPTCSTCEADCAARGASFDYAESNALYCFCFCCPGGA